jgi:hypothetical protein
MSAKNAARFSGSGADGGFCRGCWFVVDLADRQDGDDCTGQSDRGSHMEGAVVALDELSREG